MGEALAGMSLVGTIPIMKPAVTKAAAITVRIEGVVAVYTDETSIVSGKTSPLAIYFSKKNQLSKKKNNCQKTVTWKNDASTSRKQRVLNTRPMMFTETTGTSFFAVASSSFGIFTSLDTKADMWSKRTARTSCMHRKKRGSWGDEFNTALFLDKPNCLLKRVAIMQQRSVHEYHLEIKINQLFYFDFHDYVPLAQPRCRRWLRQQPWLRMIDLGQPWWADVKAKIVVEGLKSRQIFIIYAGRYQPP